jgi:ankyrin repeat protein
MLTSACIHDRSELVKVLLAKGADGNLTDEYGRTALFSAVMDEQMVIAELLV